jgi:hypothetical protein
MRRREPGSGYTVFGRDQRRTGPGRPGLLR